MILKILLYGIVICFNKINIATIFKWLKIIIWIFKTIGKIYKLKNL